MILEIIRKVLAFNLVLSDCLQASEQCVTVTRFQLTNREALTVLCSVIKHAGSG